MQVAVNGSEENPIFTFLKSSLPTPSDSKVVKLILLSRCSVAQKIAFHGHFQGNLLGNPKFINWAPVKRWKETFSFLKHLYQMKEYSLKLIAASWQVRHLLEL